MLTCFALAALATAATADIPSLAREVESDARALTLRKEITPEFAGALTDFSADAMALSDALRASGLTTDLPCIFRGISEDSHVRIAELEAAQTANDRALAWSGLRGLLYDAILLAPMAAEAATLPSP